jgi:hypothetical protein
MVMVSVGGYLRQPMYGDSHTWVPREWFEQARILYSLGGDRALGAHHQCHNIHALPRVADGHTLLGAWKVCLALWAYVAWGRGGWEVLDERLGPYRRVSPGSAWSTANHCCKMVSPTSRSKTTGKQYGPVGPRRDNRLYMRQKAQG